MQWTSPPQNNATFCVIFSGFSEITVIIIGEERKCVRLETKSCQPEWLNHPREEESRSSSHANPTEFNAAPGCVVTGKGNRQNGTNNMKSKMNNISDQAVALSARNLF